MPRAEVGSVKHLNNKLKSRGLQRLRWYCQVCEKQCRDANGFKMHTQSENHVRQMLIVGEDPKKYINDFSNMFLSDFVGLLKTGHGEKRVHINHFYQEYIANKEHVHMNATKWPSLTEFAKHLGREGICRVDEEDEKGIHIAWIDNSPDALRRQEALRRKETQMQGDEEVEQRIIREQIRRAQAGAVEETVANTAAAKEVDGYRQLKRQQGEKIMLSFGSVCDGKTKVTVASGAADGAKGVSVSAGEVATSEAAGGASVSKGEEKSTSGFSLRTAGKPLVKNVFAQAKKNVLAGGSGVKKTSAFGQPKKMSEAERIMRQEIDRKRLRDASDLESMPSGKKQLKG